MPDEETTVPTGSHVLAEAPGEGEKGLQSNALGALDAIVMAVAGSAPAYSIAATTAVLIAAVGVGSPAALLYCAIPMFGIAFAFSYLGRADVNAGASYSWVRQALHPFLGFISGWALVVSATLFMVAGSLPAGSLTLALFDPSLAGNVGLVTAIGAAWFLVMVALVIRGIRVTAHAQWIMSGIEVLLLIAFGILALVRSGIGVGAAFSWSWLGFSHFHGLEGFAGGALVAAFYYWGWDVTANLGEETRGRKAAGAGGLIGVVIVFALFEVFTIAINIILSAKTISNNPGDVLSVLGQRIWPGAGGKLLIIAVMLSTVATLETTLIQVTRSLFAMGRDNTIPRAFGRVHHSWQTPWLATAIVAVVSVGLFVASNFLGSLGTVLTDAISAIGLQITAYYGLAALAVLVLFNRAIFKSWSNFVFIGLWPALGCVFMFWVFEEAVSHQTGTVNGIGLGALALGLIPLAIYAIKRVDYYRLPHKTPLIQPVPEVPGD